MNIKSPDSKDVTGLRALWKEAFSDTDEFLDMFFGCAFSQERTFCITEGNQAVAALYFFDCFFQNDKIAYIYAVATAKSHRGKGLCKELMDYTHKALKSSGYKGAILVPGSKSLFDFYAKMGYKTSCYVSQKEAAYAENTEPAVKISADEFAALRRDFLPAKGVVQEGENIRFIGAYADFYKGKDFLFAASIEDKALICHEFLGNTQKFPEILNFLGCKNGSLRTMGTDLPFAMYLSFEGKDYPAYFGFAFD